MKNYILILMLSLCFVVEAQIDNNEKVIDTLAIVFKAKLFTISQHGVYDLEQNFINEVKNLPYKTFGKHEFIIIKIEGRYFCDNVKYFPKANWCDCDYYVAYSIKKDNFYFLGGFKTDDIKQFTKEYEGSLFSTSWNYKIEDENLSKFLDLIIRSKYKQARKCFANCTEKWE